MAPETVLRGIDLVARLLGTCIGDVEVFILDLEVIEVGSVKLTRYPLIIGFA